jgi:hypothetical protein
MQGYRKTLKFLVPKNKGAIGSFSLEDRAIVPIYINPDTISIRERKIINKQLTKGGYLIQYWGEELPVISMNGTTGSSGIEGIHILRDVYRNEQMRVKEQLIRKLQNQSDAMIGSLSGLAKIGQQADSFFGNMGQAFGTSGGPAGVVSGIFDGAKSVVDTWVDAFKGTADDAVSRTVLQPTLGAYAVSLDVYFQGERYRGYFNTFSVTERGSSPGLFDYQIEFVVTKRKGKRSNFMPWHRSPVDSTGQPVASTIPAGKEVAGIDHGLSYPPTYDPTANLRFIGNPDDLVTEGAFAGESISDAAEVDVSINRNSSLNED